MSKPAKRSLTTPPRQTHGASHVVSPQKDAQSDSEEDCKLPPRRKLKFEPAQELPKAHQVFIIAVVGDVFIGWAKHMRYKDSPAFTGDAEYNLKMKPNDMEACNITKISHRSNPLDFGNALKVYRRNRDGTENKDASVLWPAFVKVVQPHNNTPQHREEWGKGLATVLTHYGLQNKYRKLEFEYAQDLTNDQSLTHLGDHLPWDEASEIAQLLFEGLPSHKHVFENPAVMKQIFGHKTKRDWAKKLFLADSERLSKVPNFTGDQSTAAALGIKHLD